MEVAGLLIGTSLVALALGLAISALARSQDQAVSFIPLAVLPQLLLGGAIVPVSKMSAAMNHVSQLAFARWSFSGIGTVLDMAGRIAKDPREARQSPFGNGFFGTHIAGASWILALFFVVFVAVTAFLLRRRRLAA
jgi:ABC-type multidrug transport system permease subunit